MYLYDLILILKAHPVSESASDADCRKLAQYYKADKTLKFQEISSRKLPGWLVATWESPEATEGDEAYWVYEDGVDEEVVGKRTLSKGGRH